MAILGKETINDVELDENGNEIVKDPNENPENEIPKTPDPAAAIKPVTDADNPEKKDDENGEEKEAGDEENDAPKPPRTVTFLNLIGPIQNTFEVINNIKLS